MNFNQINTLPLAGCYEIMLYSFEDQRGQFIKTWHNEMQPTLNRNFTIQESFYSLNKKHVARGLHYQSPPYAQDKLISCLQGKVIDILLDIRPHSATYGKSIQLELDSKKPKSIFIDRGIAHGFVSLTNQSILLYQASEIHSSSHERGVKFLPEYIDIDIPFEHLIFSERDQQFSEFNQKVSQ
jgi:dTDP-4-dehydrorhamnose 3,5-epimerase